MNSNKVKTAITPTRAQNYPEWYQQIIKAADLAEVSPVRGCMIIKPWGFAIWENIQRVLDEQFKATGHKNLYFPLMIPLSFMQKEAAHIEGFAKECAVVTHHRLEKNEQGKLVPASPLEEPYIIRPTSETIIGDAFSRWIQSYRDLPLKINQWANIVRWEMRTRLFLRTTEFLWQEGHTAHSTSEEAHQEALSILDLYDRFAEEYMAIPTIKGEKTESERFPGAVNTYTIEAMMQDKKALQSGTSHFLGQYFSHSFNIKFLNALGKEEFVWTTSWGVSTRLVGGLIMTHSDDNGLVLPPRLSPVHIVILPIIKQEADRATILNFCKQLQDALQAITYHDKKLQVEIDARNISGGEKAWHWVKKGVPIRVEVGNKEIANEEVSVSRRDKEYKDREMMPTQTFIAQVQTILTQMQNNLLNKAKQFLQKNTVEINNKHDFYDFFAKEGGFALAHWIGDAKTEEQLKKELSVTARCIPFEYGQSKGTCIFTGATGAKKIVFGKAY